MDELTMGFITPDNRRNVICTIRFQARHNMRLIPRNYRRNWVLNSTSIRKMLTGIFTYNTLVKISNFDNPKVSFVVMKKKSTYYINGDKISGTNLNKLINFIFVKMNSYKDSDEIDDDVIKFQKIDPLITDTIINKLKYKYYSPSSNGFEETLLNMQIIGKDTVAFELYSDKWVPLGFKKAIQFIRACSGGDNKFFAIPYQELYLRATGNFLTSSEEKVIDAFLLQNRSSTLVTKRSMELVEKLSAFPAINRVEINMDSKNTVKGLHIRGKGASWLVTHSYEDDKHVLGRQNVKTQHLIHLKDLIEHEKATDGFYFSIENGDGRQLISLNESSKVFFDGEHHYMLGGNICIDQMDSNISLGDQIASRSLLLMSDKDNINKVSTLNGYARYMDLPRNLEVVHDGLFTLRPVEFTAAEGKKLTQ